MKSSANPAIVTRGSAVKRRLTAALCCALAFAGALWAQPPRAAVVPVVRPEILRVAGHDPAAFTQGLAFADTVLYESTGLVGRSSLRRVDPATGRVLASVPVPDVFAEGIAVFGGELVQLTWQNGFALRYEFPSLRAKPAMYRYAGEGWGLASDSAGFIMSNGSDTLYFRDGGFGVTRALPVTYYGRPLAQLNELEYARGHVYANVWYRNFIAEISAADGKVRRVIDCAELVGIEKPASGENVLNGIAYCERKDEWYLTGKNWKNMFVVKIPK